MEPVDMIPQWRSFPTPNKLNHSRAAGAPSKIYFQGVSKTLEDVFVGSFETNTDLVRRDRLLHRPGNAVEDVLSRITDPMEKGPFAITGKPGSGKTVLAMQCVEKLRQEGHTVKLIQNSFTLNDKDDYLNQSRLDEIKAEIKGLPPEQQYFLFLDEAMFIYRHNPPTLPTPENPNPQPTILMQLKQLSDEYPNFKVIGTMVDDTFTIWPGQIFRGNLAEIIKEELRTVFPEKHEIKLRHIGDEDKNLFFEMVNNALDYANFEPLSPSAIERLSGILPFPFRDFFLYLTLALREDADRTENPTHREALKSQHIEYVAERLERKKF